MRGAHEVTKAVARGLEHVRTHAVDILEAADRLSWLRLRGEAMSSGSCGRHVQKRASEQFSAVDSGEAGGDWLPPPVRTALDRVSGPVLRSASAVLDGLQAGQVICGWPELP